MKFIYTDDGYIHIDAITKICDPTQYEAAHIVYYNHSGHSKATRAHLYNFPNFDRETIPCPAGWQAIEQISDDSSTGYGIVLHPVLAWLINDASIVPVTHSPDLSKPEGYMTPDNKIIDCEGWHYESVVALFDANTAKEKEREERKKLAAKDAAKEKKRLAKLKKKQSEADE